jgi:hypothetical protein
MMAGGLTPGLIRIKPRAEEGPTEESGQVAALQLRSQTTAW